MRRLKLRPGQPKRRGYDRHLRQLRAWAEAVGRVAPVRGDEGLALWNAYAKPPVRNDWVGGPGGRRYARAVLGALAQAAAGWLALRPEGAGQRVLAYAYPDDLWGASVDWLWDADELPQAWARSLADGSWRPLPPGRSLLAECGLVGLLPEWGLCSSEPEAWGGVRVRELWLLGDVGDHSPGVPAKA